MNVCNIFVEIFEFIDVRFVEVIDLENVVFWFGFFDGGVIFLGLLFGFGDMFFDLSGGDVWFNNFVDFFVILLINWIGIYEDNMLGRVGLVYMCYLMGGVLGL